MGRRRLQTILATTILAAGLSTAPALAQDLGGLTTTVEEEVTTTTDEVTGTVEDTADDLLDPDGDATEDTTTEVPTDVSTEDGDDAPLSSDLDVDVAPEDEDGSPQLEVDGGVTVGDQTVDVGDATDPIEDAVDPDAEPEPEPTTPDDSSEPTDETGTSGTSSDGSRPGGFLAGGGVTAAGGDTRPAGDPGSDGTPTSGSTFAESFAAFGALNRGFGLQRFGDGTMAMRGQDVSPPQVAAPLSDDEPVDQLVVEAPRTADREVAEMAAQSAGPLGDGSGGPADLLLKGFAAALLAATGFRAKRVLDQA